MCRAGAELGLVVLLLAQLERRFIEQIIPEGYDPSYLLTNAGLSRVTEALTPRTRVRCNGNSHRRAFISVRFNLRLRRKGTPDVIARSLLGVW